MDLKRLNVRSLFKIPNENGCTNIGGIAITPTGRMYAIKTRQDNKSSTIYQFRNYKKPGYTCYAISGLGHGNGLGYSAGMLAVPPCGYELNTISTSYTHRVERYKSGRYVSSVAYKGGGIWIIKSSGKICTVRLTKEDTVEVVDEFPIENPYAERGYTVSQDIAYHDGMLYHIYSHKEKNRNCIIVSNMYNGKAKVDHILVSEKRASLYEWESLAFSPDEDMLIAANTENGDYIYKAVSWKIK